MISGADQSEMKYQHASKNCSFNSHFLITCDEAKTALLKELNKPDKQLLEISFNRHCQVLHFDGNSGLNPYAILTVNTWIDRMSPTLADLSEEEYESDEEYYSDY